MKAIVPLTVAALATLSPSAQAQEFKSAQRGVVTMAWEMAVPIGDLADVHDNVSLRGIGVDVYYFVHPMIAVGGSTSIQTFADTLENRTFQLPNGAITATLYQYTSVWQLRGLGKFFPLGQDRFAPYVGLQLGYGWVDRLVLITDFSAQDEKSAFVFTPEVGLLWQLSPRGYNGVTASFRYDFTTASFEQPNTPIDNLSYLSWTIGGFVGF
jgi:hypothetical protein